MNSGDYYLLDLVTFELFLTNTTITFVALISTKCLVGNTHPFYILFYNDNIHINGNLGFIQRYILIEIFKSPFLTFFDPQNVCKLYIHSTHWQSAIHILVDTTLILDLLSY